MGPERCPCSTRSTASYSGWRYNPPFEDSGGWELSQLPLPSAAMESAVWTHARTIALATFNSTGSASLAAHRDDASPFHPEN